MIKPAPALGWVENIPAYKGGKHGGAFSPRPIILSSNENALGPSPKALEALKQTPLHRYPPQYQSPLQELLAEKCGGGVENIVLGNGSDELLALIAQGWAGPGDEILYSAHGFLMYPICALRVGAKPVAIPEKNLKADIDAICKRANEKTKILYIANPNNPTGSFLTGDELHRLRKGLPETTLLVIDAAYADYIPGTKDNYENGLALAKAFPNVVMTRSFSKLFALAGLRLGWLYADKGITETINKLRMPFNNNIQALQAGFEGLQDEVHIQKTIFYNNKMKDFLEKALEERGLKTNPSLGNFLLCHFTDAKTAERVCDALEEKAIFIRKVAAYGLPEWLRISIGLEEELKAFLQALDRLELDPHGA